MPILQRLRAFVDHTITKLMDRGYHKLAIYLAMFPFFMIFLIAGASIGAAFAAGMGLAIIVLFPRFFGENLTIRERRILLASGAALLALAAGIQTVVKVRDIRDDGASFALLIIPALAFLAVVLVGLLLRTLWRIGRWTLRRGWREQSLQLRFKDWGRKEMLRIAEEPGGEGFAMKTVFLLSLLPSVVLGMLIHWLIPMPDWGMLIIIGVISCWITLTLIGRGWPRLQDWAEQEREREDRSIQR